MREETGTGRPAAGPDFARLVVLHHAARHRYGAAAALLVAAGIGAVLLAAGWSRVDGRLPTLPLAVTGLLAAALAALPLREALERRDRAGGLEVLGDEWARLAPDDAGGRARLLGLLRAMHGHRPPAGDGPGGGLAAAGPDVVRATGG